MDAGIRDNIVCRSTSESWVAEFHDGTVSATGRAEVGPASLICYRLRILFSPLRRFPAGVRRVSGSVILHGFRDLRSYCLPCCFLFVYSRVSLRYSLSDRTCRGRPSIFRFLSDSVVAILSPAVSAGHSTVLRVCEVVLRFQRYTKNDSSSFGFRGGRAGSDVWPRAEATG
jgi:hypothetical protein